MRKAGGVLLALALASALAADVLHLKNGNTVEGRIAKTTPEAVSIETQTARLTFPLDAVESIERGPSPLDTYREKLAAAKTVEDYQVLLTWCEANHFDTAAVKGKLKDAVAARKRAENPDSYCRECAAYGVVGCPKCRRPGSTVQERGTGRATLPCTRCRGQGTETCPACGGSWQTPCTRCNSSGSVLVPCRVCNGTGIERCPSCGGSGAITCPNHVTHTGAGSSPCPNCGSRGGPGRILCPTCRGHSPMRTCSDCNGTGQLSVVCPSCLGKLVVPCKKCRQTGKVACSACGGKGTVEDVCADCRGEGLVACPTCEGKGVTTPKAGAAKPPAAR